MDRRKLVRAAAIGVAGIIATAALGLSRKLETGPLPSRPLVEPHQDALREGQRRCQLLGQKAFNDAGCLRVWAETRDRFLGRTGLARQASGPRH